MIKFTTDLGSIKNDLDSGAAHVDEVKNDPDSLKSVRELIQSCETAYRELFGKFVDFLRATRNMTVKMKRRHIMLYSELFFVKLI